MKVITIHIPEPYLRDLDKLVHEDLFPNRAEAIRSAVREMLIAEVWEREKAKEFYL